MHFFMFLRFFLQSPSSTFWSQIFQIGGFGWNLFPSTFLCNSCAVVFIDFIRLLQFRHNFEDSFDDIAAESNHISQLT